MISDRTKTAALLTVGNEILSGAVTDSNSPYITRKLRALGVDLRRVVILPDEVDPIAEEISFCKKRFDWIFIGGGIGPTHDDVTVAGVAKGLGVPLTRHPEIVRHLSERYGSPLTSVQAKLADLPEGTQLFPVKDRLPIPYVENIYIFPGIPKQLVQKFEAIQEWFQGRPFHVAKIFLQIEEEEIAETLNRAVIAFPRLRLGSYPHPERSDYRVVLTLESKVVEELDEATRFLLVRLPHEAIVQVLEAEKGPSRTAGDPS